MKPARVAGQVKTLPAGQRDQPDITVDDPERALAICREHIAGLGRQGPDQGYALKLVRQFEDRVVLRDGERWEDASAGCVLVALKRASMFGRAPVIHDLEIAFRIFGYLDDPADDDLVALRADAFDRVDNPHHYLEARRIIDSVPEDTLRQNPKQVAAAHDRDWSALIDTDALVPAGHDHHDDD